RHGAEISCVLAGFVAIAVQVTKDRLEFAHDLAFERDVHPKNTVRRWMLRPHRHFEQFAIESRAHCCRWPLGWFECLNRRGHCGCAVMFSAPSSCGRGVECCFAFSSTSSCG